VEVVRTFVRHDAERFFKIARELAIPEQKTALAALLRERPGRPAR
jgi:hypothetical protein